VTVSTFGEAAVFCGITRYSHIEPIQIGPTRRRQKLSAEVPGRFVGQICR